MKNKLFRFVLIAVLFAIDALFLTNVILKSGEYEGIAIALGLIAHFGIAIYYYQKHEKHGSDKFPYQAYAWLGIILPWLSVFLCEGFKGKTQRIINDIVAFGLFGGFVLFIIYVLFFPNPFD